MIKEKKQRIFGRRDTQQNDIQQNDNQHNKIKLNIQHNKAHHQKPVCWFCWSFSHLRPLVNHAFCWLVILSTRHFMNRSFCELVVLSICLLSTVNLSTVHFVDFILLIVHFVDCSFCKLVICPTIHFVNWSFYQPAILSKSEFVKWSFCQLVFLATFLSACHFITGHFANRSFVN